MTSREWYNRNVNISGREFVMIKIELELDEKTIEQAQRRATFQRMTLEKHFANILEEKTEELTSGRSSLGLFADEPDMMDRVMEIVYSEREKTIQEPGSRLE